MITIIGPFARTLYTILFLVLFGACAYLSVSNQILKFELRECRVTIVELKQELETSKSEATKLNDSNNFLRQNIQLLNSYYRQKPKPPVVSGQIFNKNNLFMGSPR
jgi:hypothetical protein